MTEGVDDGEVRVAEQRLQERELLCISALRIAQMGSWSFDCRQQLLWWSPETCALFGVTAEAMGGRLGIYQTLVLAEDLPALDAAHARAWNSLGEGALEAEFRIHRPDGTVRWIYERGSVDRDAGGVPSRWFGLVMDITERKQVEQQRRDLLASEQAARTAADAASRHYRALFESAPGCYLVLSPGDFTIEAASESYLRATMTTREDITGRHLFDVFPDDPSEPSADGVSSVRASLERVKGSGETDVVGVLRYPIRRPLIQGGGFEERYWSILSSPVPGPEGKLAYIIHRVEDVTEYIRDEHLTGRGAAARVTLALRAEQLEVDIALRSGELRRASERLVRDQAILRIAGRVAKLGGWMVSVPPGAMTWSAEMAALHDEAPGYSPQDAASSVRYFLPEHGEAIQRAGYLCGTEGLPFELELPMVTAKGRQAWVRLIGEAGRDRAGVITHVQGAFQDISERRLAEAQLREQATLLDQARDAILVRDLEHRVRYWNLGAERLYGWTLAETQGRLIDELLHTERRIFVNATAITLATGAWSGELEQKNKAGQAVIVEAHWTLVRDERGEPSSILCINTDITQRRKLEAQVLRAQRMESIGALAGGIAHDLNNTLAPLLMTVSLLREAETDPTRQEDLATIQLCAERGADMVQQLLSFARGTEGRRSRVDLGALATEIRKMVKDTFPKDISFRLEVPRELWAIDADATQMHQLLTNLCVNARDAMPAGGTLTVALEHVVVDDVYAGMNLDARPGSYVMMRVEDTGTGIPPAVLDRMFEPFFTTKETGKGTGLGLSTAHAIVRSHGGFIDVYSEVGKGTRFRVYLPALVAASSAVEVVRAQAQLPRGDGELILIVDDEEAIRLVARRTLEHFGYRVVLASNGAEAVAVYAQHRGEIAVVLTDMAMPVMDGAATIVALRRLDPQALVIASSGLDADGKLAGPSAGSRLRHLHRRRGAGEDPQGAGVTRPERATSTRVRTTACTKTSSTSQGLAPVSPAKLTRPSAPTRASTGISVGCMRPNSSAPTMRPARPANQASRRPSPASATMVPGQ